MLICLPVSLMCSLGPMTFCFQGPNRQLIPLLIFLSGATLPNSEQMKRCWLCNIAAHPPTPTLSIKTPLFVFNLCVMEAPDRQCAPNILDSFLIPDYPLLIPRLRSQSFHLICWDLFAVFGFVLLRSDFLCILFSLNCIQNKCCRL